MWKIKRKCKKKNERKKKEKMIAGPTVSFSLVTPLCHCLDEKKKEKKRKERKEKKKKKKVNTFVKGLILWIDYFWLHSVKYNFITVMLSSIPLHLFHFVVLYEYKREENVRLVKLMFLWWKKCTIIFLPYDCLFVCVFPGSPCQSQT